MWAARAICATPSALYPRSQLPSPINQPTYPLSQPINPRNQPINPRNQPINPLNPPTNPRIQFTNQPTSLLSPPTCMDTGSLHQRPRPLSPPPCPLGCPCPPRSPPLITLRIPPSASLPLRPPPFSLLRPMLFSHAHAPASRSSCGFHTPPRAAAELPSCNMCQYHPLFHGTCSPPFGRACPLSPNSHYLIHCPSKAWRLLPSFPRSLTPLIWLLPSLLTPLHLHQAKKTLPLTDPKCLLSRTLAGVLLLTASMALASSDVKDLDLRCPSSCYLYGSDLSDPGGYDSNTCV